jgi:iron complex transport system substrate-binding protein
MMWRLGWIYLGLILVMVSGCREGNESGAVRSKRGRKIQGNKVPVVELARDGQTRLLRHAGGEDRVPLNPQRVVALSATDAAVFLDFVPVAQTGSSNIGMGHYLAPYERGSGHIRTAYGARMAAPESVMTFEPDLIVIDTLDGPTLNQMRKIAPTVVVSTASERWISLSSQVEQHTADVGMALGIPDRAEAALRWLRYKVELARRDLHAYLLPKFDGRMPIAMLFCPFMRMVRINRHPLLYEEGLGFTSPKVARWAGTHVSSRNEMIDAEQIADIHAEYLFCVRSDRRGYLPGYSPTEVENISQNPLWEHLPAVRDGHVMITSMQLWVSDGPLAYSLCIDDIVEFVLPPGRQTPELKKMLKARPDDADIAEVAHWPPDRGTTPLKMMSESRRNKQPKKKEKPAYSQSVSSERRKGDLP